MTNERTFQPRHWEAAALGVGVFLLALSLGLACVTQARTTCLLALTVALAAGTLTLVASLCLAHTLASSRLNNRDAPTKQAQALGARPLEQQTTR